jgi:hypothetical protein
MFRRFHTLLLLRMNCLPLGFIALSSARSQGSSGRLWQLHSKQIFNRQAKILYSVPSETMRGLNIQNERPDLLTMFALY